MKKFVQIIDKKAHWIFEAEEKPPYPDDVIIMDITGQDVSEGYLYDETTNNFIPPKHETTIIQPTLEEIAETTLIETQYQTVLIEMLAGY